MRSYALTTIEHSNPFLTGILQDASAGMHEALTPAELLNHFALPSETKDDRTQILILAGGAASGKSTLAKALQHELGKQRITVALISSDDFVRGHRGMRREWEEKEDYTPEVKYDFGYMRAVIRAICSNRDQDTYITAPKYDAYSGKALDSDKHRFIPPVSILIVEGDVLSERGVMPSALHPGEDIAAKLETVYLHVPDAARLERRLRRDMEHRNGHGETPEVIARNFESRQRTQHLPYTLRYAAVADYIVQPNARVDQHYDVARLRPTPSA